MVERIEDPEVSIEDEQEGKASGVEEGNCVASWVEDGDSGATVFCTTVRWELMRFLPFDTTSTWRAQLIWKLEQTN